MESRALKPLGYDYDDKFYTLGVLKLYFSTKNNDAEVAKKFFESLELKSNTSSNEESITLLPHIGLTGKEWLLKVDLNSKPGFLTTENICKIMLMFDNDIKPSGINFQENNDDSIQTYIDNDSLITEDNFSNLVINMFYKHKLLARLAGTYLINVINNDLKYFSISEQSNPAGIMEYKFALNLSVIESATEVEKANITNAFKILLTDDQYEKLEKMFNKIFECIKSKNSEERLDQERGRRCLMM